MLLNPSLKQSENQQSSGIVQKITLYAAVGTAQKCNRFFKTFKRVFEHFPWANELTNINKVIVLLDEDISFVNLDKTDYYNLTSLQLYSGFGFRS